MALTPIQQVRVLVGDTEGSPFFETLSDDEIQFFLDLNGQNVMLAARQAAIAISMQLAGYTSRERVGEIEVWSNLSTAYLRALDNFIKDASANTLPNGIMPYAAGISYDDICANNLNTDNVRSPLAGIRLCGDSSFSYTSFRLNNCC